MHFSDHHPACARSDQGLYQITKRCSGAANWNFIYPWTINNCKFNLTGNFQYLMDFPVQTYCTALLKYLSKSTKCLFPELVTSNLALSKNHTVLLFTAMNTQFSQKLPHPNLNTCSFHTISLVLVPLTIVIDFSGDNVLYKGNKKIILCSSYNSPSALYFEFIF